MTDPVPRPDNLRGLAIATALLLLAFAFPLWQWARFGLGSELYSYTLLVPATSVFLIWWKRSAQIRHGLPLPAAWAVGCFLGAATLLGAMLLAPHDLGASPIQNRVAVQILALVLLFVGACSLCLTRDSMRAYAFPLAFLAFAAPLPLAVENDLETLLQHGSAAVAESLFHLIGTPVYRDGTLFTLPNFKMQVAPECSGIHSTIALFLTSLAAGCLFLRRWWSRTILFAVVLPLALVRNGFRVTTIGELCVREGPQMIDHYIHHHGGPIFFALSLIPFGIILYLLVRLDRPRSSRPASPA